MDTQSLLRTLAGRVEKLLVEEEFLRKAELERDFLSVVISIPRDYHLCKTQKAQVRISSAQRKQHTKVTALTQETDESVWTSLLRSTKLPFSELTESGKSITCAFTSRPSNTCKLHLDSSDILRTTRRCSCTRDGSSFNAAGCYNRKTHQSETRQDQLPEPFGHSSGDSGSITSLHRKPCQVHKTRTWLLTIVFSHAMNLIPVDMVQHLITSPERNMLDGPIPHVKNSRNQTVIWIPKKHKAVPPYCLPHIVLYHYQKPYHDAIYVSI